MKAANTSSKDLLLKIVDGPGDSVIPVKSTTCLLKETHDSGDKSQCSLLRDEDGALVKSASNGVTINGAPAFAQRLQIGDRIQLGKKAYEVIQLGSLSSQQQENSSTQASDVKKTVVGEKIQLVRVRNPKPSTRTEMIEQSNQVEPQMSSDQITSRIDRIESELGRQSDNFDNVNKRFDDLSHQMSALLNVMSNAAPSADAQTTDQSNDTQSPVEVETQQPVADSQTSSLFDSLTSETTVEETQVADESQEQSSAMDAVFGNLQQQSESSQEAPVLDVQEAVSQTENSNEGLEVTSSSPDDLTLDAFSQNDCKDSCAGQCGESCEPTTEVPNAETIETNESSNVISSDDTGEKYETEAEHQPLTDEENQRMLDRLSALTGAGQTETGNDTDESEASSEVAEISNQQLESDAEETLDGLLSSLDSITEPTTVDETASATESTTESFASDLSTETPTESAQTEEPAEESGQLESLFASLREKDRLDDEKKDELEAASTETEQENVTQDAGSLSADLLQSLENDKEDKPVMSLREQMGLGNTTSPSEEGDLSSGTDSLLSDSGLLQTTSDEEQEKPSLSLREQMGLGDLTTESTTPDEGELTDSMVSKQEPVQTEVTEEQPGSEADSDTQSSVADILARMNMMPTEGQDDGATGIVEDVQPEPTQPEPVQTPEAPVADESQAGGEDVQDYMNSLLQRLNGGEAPAPAPTPKASQPAADQTQAVVEEKVEPATPVVPLEPLNAENFVPSASAPERTKDLAAMRKLANASSRNAVQRSNQKRKKVMSNNLLIMAIAGVIGAILTAFLSSQTGDGYYLLAIALFGATMVASGLYGAINFLNWDVDFSKLLSFLPKSKKADAASGVADLGNQEDEVVEAAIDENN